jgi:poly(3-hydroxybutyrate) depolymerase
MDGPVVARFRRGPFVGLVLALVPAGCSESSDGDDAAAGAGAQGVSGASGSSTSGGAGNAGVGGGAGSANGGSQSTNGGSAGASGGASANGGSAGSSGGSETAGSAGSASAMGGMAGDGAAGEGTAGSGTAGAGSGGGTATSGCGHDPPESGERSLTLDAEERTYILDLPPSYEPATPYPIVFGFHGASTSGSTFRSSFYGNLLSAMGDDAIVVHPDALGDPTSWETERDVPFFDALVETLSSELCIDADRIFATGHSSGGFFSNALGCERGDVLRAIAPVSGGGPFVFGGASCTGEVAAWLAHGENDETVEFSSGEDSRDHWLEANGCSETSAAVTPPECVEYEACNDGLPVRWCVYQEGHDWPEFAPQAMWDFFQGLP